MRSAFLAAVVAWTLSTSASGQDPHAGFLAEAADRLHQEAQGWFDSGFPLRAKKIWLEVIAEYAPDHAAAWRALGFQRFGTVWAPDTTRPYPDRDTGAPAKERALARMFEATTRKLIDDHRQVAEELSKAGRQDAAQWHYRRVLRFQPTDKKAAQALDYRAFDGVFGSAEELNLLARSRRLSQALQFLRGTTFKVEVLPPTEHQPHLAAARVEHRGVRSPHFKIWGDVGVANLEAAAQTAERCLWFCRTVFGTESAARSVPLAAAEVAFFQKLDTWQRVLRANAALFDDQQLDFLLKHCLAAYLVEGQNCLYAAHGENRAYILDQVARTVAADLANVSAPALKEGVGHAVAAMFFGRNLVYLLDQPERASVDPARTRAPSSPTSGDQTLLLPELDAWLQAAVQQAWSQDGVPAAQLPLLHAGQFTVAQRVKAWAWCDWLLRRGAGDLQQFDAAGAGAASAADVEREFARQRGTPLAGVESEWRRFWVEESRLLLYAMHPPARPIDKQALPWMTAINERRLAAGLCPLGWFESPAAAAKAVVEGNKPAEVVAAYLERPGYRHGLLDPELDLVGIGFAQSQPALDFGRQSLVKVASMAVWPRDQATAVPAGFALDKLGPAAVAAMGARLAAGATHVGYPLALHCYGPVVPQKIECAAQANGRPVEGVVCVSTGTGDPRSEGKGLVLFYPLAPWPAGAQVSVRWSWSDSEHGTRRELAATFTVR